MINVNVEYAAFIQKASDTLYIMLDGQKKTHSEVVSIAEMLLPIATGMPNIKSNQTKKITVEYGGTQYLSGKRKNKGSIRTTQIIRPAPILSAPFLAQNLIHLLPFLISSSKLCAILRNNITQDF